MYSTELVVQTFISGVMIGVLYALMALGITFIYSIMRMINWAMGEFYMIGSYLQYMLVAWLLGPDLWWVAVVVSADGVFVMGLFVQWSLLKPIFKKPPEARDPDLLRRVIELGVRPHHPWQEPAILVDEAFADIRS